MYHYTLKVPENADELTPMVTIIDRIDYYNDSNHYIFFDSYQKSVLRFLLVTKKRITKEMHDGLKNIFGIPVKTEPLCVKQIDGKTIKKIHTIKMLMGNNFSYYGDKKSLFVLGTPDKLIKETEAMIGFGSFKTFFKEMNEYIDRTADMRAKCLHNVVLINNSGINIDAHIDLLCGLYASKGLLYEHAVITIDVDDACAATHESKCIFAVNDSWGFESDGEYLNANDEVKLLRKIVKSENIYITTMNQEQYDKISMLDCFASAFPNIVTLEKLSDEEKINYVCTVADEYGFTVNTEGFEKNRFVTASSVEKIESSLRQAIHKKIKVNNNDFSLDIADIDTKAKKIKKTTSFDELEKLIGLEGVKSTVSEIVAFLKRKGKNAVPCLHMCFTGNPGTGKTTVARIIARIFYEAGITKKNLLVETERGGLIGMYVGHTAKKTANKIESAMGGVLFIDEAYSLFSESGIDYGHEAVATLVKAMEDKRDDFVCILAGYTNEMWQMLDMNPGLRDRVQFYIDFPDYNEAELMKIFENLCKENKYKLTKTCKDTLGEGFSRFIAAKGQNFSNGRFVRKIFERTRMKQALRASNNIITEDDIQAVFAEKDIAALFNGKGQKPIGFMMQ